MSPETEIFGNYCDLLLSSLTDESIRVVILYLASIYDRETAGQFKRRRWLH